MNQSEAAHTAALINRFADEHADLISPEAVRHLEAVDIILRTIGPLLPAGPVTTLGRIGGLCPCEIADRIKSQ